MKRVRPSTDEGDKGLGSLSASTELVVEAAAAAAGRDAAREAIQASVEAGIWKSISLTLRQPDSDRSHKVARRAGQRKKDTQGYKVQNNKEIHV